MDEHGPPLNKTQPRVSDAGSWREKSLVAVGYWKLFIFALRKDFCCCNAQLRVKYFATWEEVKRLAYS